MPKYLIHGSYTEEGLKGLLEEGGTKRRDAAERLLASVGGTVEAYYFAFGENDFYLVADMPDNVAQPSCFARATKSAIPGLFPSASPLVACL